MNDDWYESMKAQKKKIKKLEATASMWFLVMFVAVGFVIGVFLRSVLQ